MDDSDVDILVERAKHIYEERLKSELEPTQKGRYLAIEPVSGEYFLGRTLSEAAAAARAAHPGRQFFGMRIGYKAAVEIGNRFA